MTKTSPSGRFFIFRKILSLMSRYTFMRFFLILTLSVCTWNLQAQVVTRGDASRKALKHFEAGIEYAMGSQFPSALEAFEKAIDAEPGFIDARIFAGDVCMELKRYEDGRKYFQGALDLQDDYDVGVYKKISVAEQFLMMYEEALEHIEIFLEHPRITGVTREKAERLRTSLLFAMEAIKDPLDFEPYNMGPALNSRYDEYFPSLSADQSVLVFTRNLIDTFETESGTVMLKGNEDFYLAKALEESWDNAFNIGKPVNSKLNEGAQNISADGRWLYFTLCNGPMGYGSCDIYYAYRYGEEWSSPENCGKRINSGNWDSQPSVSADGKSLFFVSNRPGGYGGSDIWMARMGDDGYWESAVNLGPGVNTDGEENSPFIHPDGITLYFASDGHPGMGGTDLFYTRRDLEGRWTEPVNLVYPLNTSYNEATIHLCAFGGTAYYSSDRGDSYGGLDLYAFPVPDRWRPEPVTYVRATVLDAKTRQPVNANLQLFSLHNDSLLLRSQSDPVNGRFLVTLPSGQEYGLYVEKEGYLFKSIHFSLADGIPDKPYLIEVLLQPVNVGEVITLQNIFFNSGSAEILSESAVELGKVKQLLSENPGMRISVNGHTDDIGEENDNQVLSEARAKAVVRFLTDAGIDEGRMSWKGYGESRPVAENDTDEGRAKNRRTELEILAL